MEILKGNFQNIPSFSMQAKHFVSNDQETYFYFTDFLLVYPVQ